MRPICSKRLIAASCMFFAVLFTAVSSGGPTDADLEELIVQYSGVESVHATAILEARFYVEDPDQQFDVAGKRVSGEYRYWAQGEKYRIVSALNPEVFPWMNNEVAYDGQLFQLLRRDRGVLSFGHGDRDIGTAVLPNPFFAVVSFLYPQDDDTWDRTIKLQDVSLDADIASAISEVQWTSQLIDSREVDSAVFPGAFLEGEPYAIRIAADTTSRNEPLRLDFVAISTGQAILTIELSHFEKADLGGNSGQRWPRVIEYSAYTPDGGPIVRLKYIITRLEIDQEFDDSIFWIDVAEADVLWSDELQIFIH